MGVGLVLGTAQATYLGGTARLSANYVPSGTYDPGLSAQIYINGEYAGDVCASPFCPLPVRKIPGINLFLNNQPMDWAVRRSSLWWLTEMKPESGFHIGGEKQSDSR